MSQYKAYTSLQKIQALSGLGRCQRGHWEVKRLRHVGRYSNSGVDKKSYEDQQTVESFVTTRMSILTSSSVMICLSCRLLPAPTRLSSS